MEIDEVASSKNPSNYEEMFMQQSLNFAESLKGLKNLRGQLYSAAEHFETSYHNKESDHKQMVVDSSKDYISKALVSTVDHLGSVADKLSKFLDQRFNDLSATKIRFSCTEQRLNMFRGFVDSIGLSQESLMMIKASNHHKQYIVSDDSGDKASQETAKKPQTPFSRKGHYLRIPPNVSSLSPQSFSFTRVVTAKETVSRNRSTSPLRFALKRSGSVSNRSASPYFSDNNKHQLFRSEPRRAVSVRRRTEIPNKDREIDLYSKRSKPHLFRALLNAKK